MKHRWIGCLLLTGGLNAWAAIAVELSAPTIALGDTVRLTLSYDPATAQGIPDLTPLQTAFTILATEQTMSYSVVNGQAHATGQWSIVLRPIKAGIILIPSINIGQQASPVVHLTVNASSQSLNQQATQPAAAMNISEDGVKLTATANDTSPYLHQEVIYTVRLLSRQQMVNVRYHHPHADDAIVFPLGEGRQYETTVNGELYHVDEQQYAIFPQKSGPLLIVPPSLEAIVYVSTPKQIALRGRPVTLQVHPLPKQHTLQGWLPSKLVRLREAYDQPATTLVQGTTLIRTIHLQAQGLVAKLLPQLSFSTSKQFSAYPGTPETKNDIKQGELWGETTQTISYVLTEPGMVTLPAIKVPWFNVKTNQVEIAELPAKTIRVKVNQSTAKPSTHVHVSSPSPRLSAPPASALRPILKQYGLWGMLSVFGLSAAFFGYRNARSRVNLLAAVRGACKANDPVQAREALLKWAKQSWPQAVLLDLSDIAKLVNDDVFKTQLLLLSAALYASKSTSLWQGQGLWAALQRLKRSPSVGGKKRKQVLPSIYPE